MSAESWPPQDPTAHRPHSDFALDRGDSSASGSEDDGPSLVLPDSPWTYANGSVNPNLQPSNAYRRASKQKGKGKTKTGRTGRGVANVPPYHPDYVDPSIAADSEVSSGDEDYVVPASGHKVRRGSEGYEVKPVDREAILQRYIMSRGDEVGHYKRYKPEPASEESELEEGDGTRGTS